MHLNSRMGSVLVLAQQDQVEDNLNRGDVSCEDYQCCCASVELLGGWKKGGAASWESFHAFICSLLDLLPMGALLLQGECECLFIHLM